MMIMVRAKRFTPKQRQEIKSALRDIFDRLKENGKVTIHGYGTFKVVDLKKRKIRNINTGEMITIPAHSIVRFHQSSSVSVRAPKERKRRVKRMTRATSRKTSAKRRTTSKRRTTTKRRKR